MRAPGKEHIVLGIEHVQQITLTDAELLAVGGEHAFGTGEPLAQDLDLLPLIHQRVPRPARFLVGLDLDLHHAFPGFGNALDSGAAARRITTAAVQIPTRHEQRRETVVVPLKAVDIVALGAGDFQVQPRPERGIGEPRPRLGRFDVAKGHGNRGVGCRGIVQGLLQGGGQYLFRQGRFLQLESLGPDQPGVKRAGVFKPALGVHQIGARLGEPGFGLALVAKAAATGADSALHVLICRHVGPNIVLGEPHQIDLSQHVQIGLHHIKGDEFRSFDHTGRRRVDPGLLTFHFAGGGVAVEQHLLDQDRALPFPKPMVVAGARGLVEPLRPHGSTEIQGRVIQRPRLTKVVGDGPAARRRFTNFGVDQTCAYGFLQACRQRGHRHAARHKPRHKGKSKSKPIDAEPAFLDKFRENHQQTPHVERRATPLL